MKKFEDGTGQGSELGLKVMTFNLRNLGGNDESPHTWEERRPTVSELIRMEEPDIFGTQEALYQQVKDIEKDLPHYNWIGLGREGGSNGEFVPIYYDKNRFIPLEFDHYWLSDTPEVIGSTSWGNMITRMVTWVKIMDHKTKSPFYFVNTHFDHESVEAREKSALMILHTMNAFDPKLPVILTGDFNASPDSKPHHILTSKGSFQDLWDTAQTRINEELGTFNGFRDPTGRGPDSRIDWILSKGNVTANTIKINNYQKKGQFPSDHYPVIADVTFS